MRENHYAISCIDLKISYVFNKQDEHNASNFSECHGAVIIALALALQETFPTAKIRKKL